MLTWNLNQIKTNQAYILIISYQGDPAGLFHSLGGWLRQGNPLSPYLFVLAMEALSFLLKRGLEGGFISGLKVGGQRPWESGGVSPFVCRRYIDFLWGLQGPAIASSLILTWFEAILKLKINLEKNELILVERILITKEFVGILACRVGSLPSKHLGLSLGVVF